MNAKELIGIEAIRTAPIYSDRQISNDYSLFGGEVKSMPDYSYCSSPILIVNATDSHIIYHSKSFDKGEYDFDKEPRVLDCRYCDDNWTDYDSLVHPTVRCE